MHNNYRIITEIMLPASLETLYMVFFGTVFSCIIGIVLAIVLVITDKHGLKPNKKIYSLLDILINTLRSFPFVVLAIAVLPITRFIAGSTIGKRAALVPLVIVAAPFVARVIESNLKDVDVGVIESAKSYGASNFYIIFNIMFKEALPSICLSITLVAISILGSSAVAGTLGAGGLGSVVLIYGYQSCNNFIMYGTVFILFILVQGIQFIGNLIYKKLI